MPYFHFFMSDNLQFPWKQEFVIHHTLRLMNSFQYWFQRCLLDVSGSPEKIAQAVFEAPFVLVSHGTEPDPIFNYGNRKALELWELSWEEFTRMPSKKTAQNIVHSERNKLLAETAAKGFSKFSGVRITSTGRPFYIEDGTIWNLLDENHHYCGQAAVYSHYKFLL
jgi:hypothetical protein